MQLRLIGGGGSLSLDLAANLCREVALEVQKQKITTSAGFITLIAEQVGDIAKAYWHEGRESADIPEEVTDMIVVGLCYLNWLGLSNEKLESHGIVDRGATQKHQFLILKK